MDTESTTWHLMKQEDGTTFGPVPFEQIREWAMAAQIAPHDRLSTDGQTWVKAPTIPELGMDWLVVTAPDQLYGPTTSGTVREFLVSGEITESTPLINCVTGEQVAVCDVPALVREERIGGQPIAPGRTGIRQNLQQRIRDLERALLEQRRLLEQAEERCRKLETRLAEFTVRKV